MTVVFPLEDLVETLHVASVSFKLNWGQEISGQGSGRLRVKDLRPALWGATLESRELSHGEALQVQARINALQGALYTFLAYNPIGKYPQADPTGATLGSASVTVSELAGDNKRIKLAGLPANYVLTAGDFLSFSYSGGNRALHQILEGVQAGNEGNTPLFEVRPHIRPGADVGQSVKLKKPVCEMLIMPGTDDIQSKARQGSTVRFQALQVL